MFGQSGYAAAMQPLPGWTLLFAREPEPDLDIDDLPQGLDEDPGQRLMDKKPPNRRPLMWVLVLVLVGVAVYALIQPDVLQMLGLGAPEPPKPAIARPAKPAVPSGPAAPAAPPSPAAPAPSIPAPSATVPPAPVAPPPGAPSPSAQAARPSVPGPVPTPLFKEGQRVVVQSDPKQLTSTVFLSADSAGVMPGPLVKPGSLLIVTDGELRNNAWVYSVRTEDGAVGWIAESRLKVKS